MEKRRVYVALIILIVASGVSTAILFVKEFVAAGLLVCVTTVVLIGWAVNAARARHRGDPPEIATGGPKPAIAPPDGHIRFTLVVENLPPERVAEVWADLCRAERPATEEFRLLFRNFTVADGRRFRFRKGDPTATAALLTSVLGAAAGLTIRTSLEPAAERTPPWS